MNNDNQLIAHRLEQLEKMGRYRCLTNVPEEHWPEALRQAVRPSK